MNYESCTREHLRAIVPSFAYYEVIGIIYENPELLEVAA